jgi:tricorn protease
VENYGVNPDIEVEYRPQDYVARVDPQLRRGVDELLKQPEGQSRTVQFYSATEPGLGPTRGQSVER